MPITTLITEAKKTIPAKHELAHAWLDDLLTTHPLMPDPANAIRFFMLGMHSSGAITFNNGSEFKSLIVAKTQTSIHW